MDFAQFSALFAACGDLRHQCDPKLLLNIYLPLFETKLDPFYRLLLSILTLLGFFAKMSYAEINGCVLK